MQTDFFNTNFKILTKSELSFVSGGTEVPVPYPCIGSGSTGTTSGGTVGSTDSTSNGDEGGVLKDKCVKSK